MCISQNFLQKENGTNKTPRAQPENLQTFPVSFCFLLVLVFSICAFSEDYKSPVSLFVLSESRTTGEAILPGGWKTISGKNTSYTLLKNDSGLCLHAISTSGNRTIGKQISYSINDYPALSWRWKVTVFPQGAREDIKNKNDSPAGVYIMFKDGYSFKSLKYVWSAQLPVGSVLTSHYNSDVKIIVLESGAGKNGAWASECVNLKNDINRFIGKNLTQIIGIGILTDADNTRTSSQAAYTDLRLQPY